MVRINRFCAVCASFGFPEVVGPVVLGLCCLGEGEGVEGPCVQLLHMLKKMSLDLDNSVAFDDAILVEAADILKEDTHVVFFH